jgi:hypothetical protein
MVQPYIMRDLHVVGGQGVQSTRKWIWTGDYAKFEPLNKGAQFLVRTGSVRIFNNIRGTRLAD